MTRPDGTRFKVLIVDDSIINLALISEMLNKHGYEAHTAISGTDALEKVEKIDIDLILLDIMMPKIDGFEVCLKLKANENTRKIPVIFLTAVTNTNSIVKGFEVGGVDYITKPFQGAELLKRVQTHIELKYSKEQLLKQLNERLKVENALSESEKKFRTVFENSPTGIVLTDEEGRIIEWNNRMIEMTEFLREDVVGKYLWDIQIEFVPIQRRNPELFDKIKNYMLNLLSGSNENQASNNAPVEHSWTLKDGLVKKTLAYSFTIATEKGNRLVTIMQDYTERKKAEVEIIQNLKDQEFLTLVSQELIQIDEFENKIEWLLSELGKKINVSRVYIFENFENGRFAKNTFEWCNSGIDSHKELFQNFDYQKYPEFEKLAFEQGILCSSDVQDLPQSLADMLIQVDIKSILLFPLFVNNDFFGFFGFDQCDVNRIWKKTEIELTKTISNLLSNVFGRIIAHRKLKESEINFRSIFLSSSDIILIIAMDGRVIEINDLATKILGFTKEEFLQMKVSELMTSGFQKFFKERVSDPLKILESPINEYEILDKDGKVIYMEVNSKIVQYSGQAAILSVARDLTERKHMERKILSTIIETEEKERNRFAKDLHDGLGALLSSINIYINMIRSKELGEAEEENMLIYTKGLVDEAISTAKEIANDLRPTILSRFGLIASVEQFCNQINNTRAIQVDFDYKQFNGQIDKNSEIILFRIVNELINNTLKHAQAKIINIRLYNQKQNLVLEYNDDGIGFDESTKKKDPRGGMGLENIKSRIKSIDGNVQIKSKLGEGVFVKIEIKL